MYTPKPYVNRRGGMGMDLGFTYQRMLRDSKAYLPHTSESGCRYVPYKYRAGLSIIDIGNIKFNTDSINFAGYDVSSFDFVNYNSAIKHSSNPLNLFAAQDFDVTKGHVKKTNKIKLPTFICAQFDYNIWASALYINATIIQGTSHRMYTFGIRHPNSLTITPRYETKLIDVSIPISFYEYKYTQLGLSVRIGPVTIGSDKFVGWIINNDLYGGDIYFYTKIPIYYHPKCKTLLRKRDLARKGKSGKSKIDCAF